MTVTSLPAITISGTLRSNGWSVQSSDAVEGLKGPEGAD
jgi:hypothetical protein